MKLKRKGFTIIELLVAVTIIGLLAGIVSVNLRESQKQARDARRKADLNTILAALTLYYNDNNTFSLAGCNCGYNNEGRGWFNYAVGGTGSYGTSIASYLVSSKYLNSIVIDPSGETSCSSVAGGSCETEGGGPYMLHYNTATGKKVTVYAKMESAKSIVDVNNSCSSSSSVEPALQQYCDDYHRNYSLTIQK